MLIFENKCYYRPATVIAFILRRGKKNPNQKGMVQSSNLIVS